MIYLYDAINNAYHSIKLFFLVTKKLPFEKSDHPVAIHLYILLLWSPQGHLLHWPLIKDSGNICPDSSGTEMLTHSLSLKRAISVFIKSLLLAFSICVRTRRIFRRLLPPSPPSSSGLLLTCTMLFPAATVALLHIRLLVETSLSSWASLRSISAWNTSFWSCFSTTPRRTTFKVKHTQAPKQVNSGEERVCAKEINTGLL